MNRLFRKYHRTLAIIAFLPLALTVITGMLFTIVGEWFGNEELADKILGVHTLEIFGLGGFYPVLNGLALIGMLITGITMTSLFRKQREVQS